MSSNCGFGSTSVSKQWRLFNIQVLIPGKQFPFFFIQFGVWWGVFNCQDFKRWAAEDDLPLLPFEPVCLCFLGGITNKSRQFRICLSPLCIFILYFLLSFTLHKFWAELRIFSCIYLICVNVKTHKYHGTSVKARGNFWGVGSHLPSCGVWLKLRLLALVASAFSCWVSRQPGKSFKNHTVVHQNMFIINIPSMWKYRGRFYIA